MLEEAKRQLTSEEKNQRPVKIVTKPTLGLVQYKVPEENTVYNGSCQKGSCGRLFWHNNRLLMSSEASKNFNATVLSFETVESEVRSGLVHYLDEEEVTALKFKEVGSKLRK